MLLSVPSTIEKKDLKGSYLAYVISLSEIDAFNYTIHKRYSQLHKFQALFASFLPLTLTSSFPPFPPKTLSRLSTPQKEKRRLQIETYLQHVVQAVLPQLQQERDDKNLHLENLDSSVIQDDSGNESILVVNEFLEISEHFTPSLPPPSVKNDNEKYENERKNKLMEQSSVVSSNLIRIYYLDCTFKTIRFNESTTLGEIVVEKVSPFVHFNLLESAYDVRLPQLALVPNDTKVVDIVAKWSNRDGGIQRQKLVAPIFSGVLANNDDVVPLMHRTMSMASSSARSRLTSAMSVATAATLNTNLDSSYTDGSGNASTPPRIRGVDPPGGGQDDLATLLGRVDMDDEGKFMHLRIKHAELQKKYDMLKAICKKKGRDRTLSLSSRANLDKIRHESDTNISTSNNADSAGKLLSSKDVALCGNLEKLSDYKKVWNKRYFILKGDGQLNYYYSEPSSSVAAEDSSSKKKCVDLRNCTRIVRSSRELALSIITKNERVMLLAPSKASFNDWFTVLTDLHMYLTDTDTDKDTNSRSESINPDSTKNPWGSGKSLSINETDDTEENPTIDASVHVVIEQDEIDKLDFEEVVAVAKGEKQKGKGKGKGKTSGITARTFLHSVTALDRFFFTFDRDYMHQLFKQSSTSPDHMSQAYEVISAMQIMYTNALGFGERWTSMFKKWILSNLKQNLTLPVQRPDLLMAVVNCMSKEHMLHSSETVREVEYCIDAMFELEDANYIQENDMEGEEELDETKQLLQTVKSMIDTLYVVVDDLIPMLPSDFNVLTMFQKAAEKRIQLKVGVFYEKNKENLDVDELLTLLSWADNHKHLMERFGVFNVSEEFLEIEKDLYEKYSNRVSGLQLQWQERIIGNDSSHVVNSKSDDTKVTSWPEDLMTCVSQQLNLAINRLQGKNLCPICSLCIDTIITFHASLAAKFSAEVESMSVESICAFSNDCYRFADLLQEQTSLLDALDEDSAELVGDKMGELIMMFSELSTTALKAIVEVIGDDVKSELMGAMLAEDSSFANNYTTGKDEMANVGEVLHNMADNVKAWLSDDSLLVYVLKNCMVRLIKCYLETLLRAQPKIDEFGEVMRQIRDDCLAIENIFVVYEDLLIKEMIDKEVKVLVQIINCLELDLALVVDFWMSKLVKSFGSSSMVVVESILVMRGANSSDLGKSIVEQIKTLKTEHGANIIHDGSCFYLLDIKLGRVRKRDLLKGAVLKKRNEDGKKVFQIRRNSTMGSENGSGRNVSSSTIPSLHEQGDEENEENEFVNEV